MNELAWPRSALALAQRLVRRPQAARWRRPLHWLRDGLLRTLPDSACYAGGSYERILPYEWDVALGDRLALPPAVA